MTHHALVIDDNQNNADVLASLLAESSIEATALTNSIEAADAIRAEQFTLVFVDLEMPGNTGFDIFDLVSGNPAYSDVPVVAYSVHIAEANKARRIGFHSFLSKPLKHDQFAGQLSRILAGEAVWDI